MYMWHPISSHYKFQCSVLALSFSMVASSFCFKWSHTPHHWYDDRPTDHYNRIDCSQPLWQITDTDVEVKVWERERTGECESFVCMMQLLLGLLLLLQPELQILRLPLLQFVCWLRVYDYDYTKLFKADADVWCMHIHVHTWCVHLKFVIVV